MRLITAGILGAAMLAASGQAGAATLTAQDYIDIEQLNARYAFAIDQCTNSGYDYADLYTDDGTFGVSEAWGDKGKTYAAGREALATVAGGGKGGCRDPKGTIGYGIKHVITDHVITPTAEGAHGKSILLAFGVGGVATQVEHQGGYEDTYVKTDKGWRMKSRVHVFPNIATSVQFGPLRQKAAEDAKKQQQPQQ